MIEPSEIRTRDDGTEIHLLPMACVHERRDPKTREVTKTTEELNSEFDSHPKWPLEVAIMRLNDLTGEVSIASDQWSRVSADFWVYSYASPEGRVRYDEPKKYMLSVECDSIRHGVLRLHDYALQMYDTWHGEPYDDPFFDIYEDDEAVGADE